MLYEQLINRESMRIYFKNANQETSKNDPQSILVRVIFGSYTYLFDPTPAGDYALLLCTGSYHGTDWPISFISTRARLVVTLQA